MERGVLVQTGSGRECCGNVVGPWLSSFESPAHPVKSLTSTCPAPGAHSTATTPDDRGGSPHGRYEAAGFHHARRRRDGVAARGAGAAAGTSHSPLESGGGA